MEKTCPSSLLWTVWVLQSRLQPALGDVDRGGAPRRRARFAPDGLKAEQRTPPEPLPGRTSFGLQLVLFALDGLGSVVPASAGAGRC